MGPSEIDEPATQTAAGGDWPEVLSAFLRLGLTSFGGPSRISDISSWEFDGAPGCDSGTEEWMAFFRDPSGNLLTLVERRSWTPPAQ